MMPPAGALSIWSARRAGLVVGERGDALGGHGGVEALLLHCGLDVGAGERGGEARVAGGLLGAGGGARDLFGGDHAGLRGVDHRGVGEADGQHGGQQALESFHFLFSSGCCMSDGNAGPPATAGAGRRL